MAPREPKLLRLAAVGVVLLLVTGCRGQVVSVQNDSNDPVNISVAQSWSGVLSVPAHGQGDLKARLRPGVVEVAVERGGTATALNCAYEEGQGRVFVRIRASGKAVCGNSPVDSTLP